jgi:hypothetical protein
MWFDEDRIVFLGDVCPWSITRDQLLRIERAAMKSATSAYFGAVHVVLHFARPDGITGCVRLHRPGVRTQSANSRALDDLADRLESWKTGARPFPPAMGFAVMLPQGAAE